MNATESLRVPMLNMRRLGEFKYDVREVMNANEMDPAFMQTFMASIIAKASRLTIVEAKEYVREQNAAGVISKEIADNLLYLLDRYTKYQSQRIES
jgi:hypothetical protein